MKSLLPLCSPELLLRSCTGVKFRVCEGRIVCAMASCFLGPEFSVLQDEEWVAVSHGSTAVGMTGRPFLGLIPLFSNLFQCPSTWDTFCLFQARGLRYPCCAISAQQAIGNNCNLQLGYGHHNKILQIWLEGYLYFLQL